MATFLAFRAASLQLRPQTAVLQCLYAPCPISLSQFARHKSTKSVNTLINKAIPYRVVQLVDPQTEKLHEPQELSEILGSINTKTDIVVLVNSDPTPIVKIVNKQEAYEKRKAAKIRAKAAAKAPETKEVQMTWGVAEGDLEHKLNKVRQELEKGNRVNLAFAPKKGQSRPTPADMQARAQAAVDALEDVGKEWKPREVQKFITILFFQGTRKDLKLSD